MVYVALFGAIAMQNSGLGVLYMLLFGLGTIPLMTLVVYMSQLLTIPIRQKIQRAIPVMVVFIGTLFILRGMGLDIPFISPGQMSLFLKAQPDCAFP
jgi:sulfite exporter TauE/SafE